ncbi:mannitol dehydrogenase family protein [Marinobacterium rhizophilum]|uniref:mannitol dehydrogenase family protein n=1 Tax=Marinobacterium rhizophilum TaxID=420402 RepID=UPI0003649986|nr:mannitol dehydrogenase family protein [Marinobacterium rhizophilum]
MQIERIASSRATDSTATGIVHLGLGAFHRAHQAVYLEQYLALKGGDWGICSANIRANQTLVDQLSAAEYRYPVVEYRSREQACVREIRAIQEALFAGSDAGRETLLQRLAAPDTRIVTLTITEKGYYLEPSVARLRLDDPAIQHDLARPQSPKTAPGLLLEALRRRRLAGIAPFTVLSCDNMPHNGRRTRAAVLALASRQDPELHDWIKTHVCFPGSMVDRIVPAMTPEDFARLARELDCTEPTAVICESFSQWVVEDNFSLGRPEWECVGVQMVDDVTPFETMKLRMLNGSHSLLAYLGPLAGYRTVAQAMQDPAIRNFLHHYMLHEAVPTLQGIDPAELQAYATRLLQRFANDSLQHQLHQIAMDGSQKLPQRWLDGCQVLLDTHRPIACTALGIAAWINHVQQAQSERRELNDPLAPRLLALAESHRDQPQELLAAFLAQDDIFAPALAANSRFQEALSHAYSALQQGPLPELLKQLTAHSD